MKNNGKKLIVMLMAVMVICLPVVLPASASEGFIITPPTVTFRTDNPEYGTPLGDIIDLEGGSASLNGKEVQGTFTLEEPEKLYDAGKYTNETVRILFNSSDKAYTDYPVSVYVSFTVIKRPITVTVEYDVRKYKQDNPPFEYRISEGTLVGNDSIEDIVAGLPVCAATSGSDAGEYEITLASQNSISNYEVTVVNDILTIEPAVVISFSADEPFADSDYWRTIFANSIYNSEEELINFLAKEKSSYKARHGQDTFNLIPLWSADAGNAPFNPRGTGLEVSYSYTAALTMEAADSKNYEIDIENPRAHIRVIPVNAVQTLDKDSATLAAADIKELPDGRDVEDVMGLPQTAAVTYILDEKYKGADRYESDKFRGGTDTYAISGWKMDDGRDLTLEALRAKADGIAAGQEAEIMLTPVYAVDGDNAVPVWATLEEAPQFTLIITEKVPVAVNVTPPANITYGDGELEDPRAAQEAIGGNGIDENGFFTCRYVGVGETVYDSEEKPTAAGKYRVVAVLESATHSGRGISETFVISPRTVTVSGITGKDKEYDGNTDVVLDTQNARIKGMVDGDDLQVTASGYFDGKKVGSGKTVVIIDIALTGMDADNYSISLTGSQTGTKAAITRKPLTVDDSGITVTKEYDGTVNPGTLEGMLKLTGLVDGDNVSLTGKVIVGAYADPEAGENKTVELSGIKLTGSDADNYSYNNKSATVPWKYTFAGAEITVKPRPVLGTHFTVTLPRRSPYDGSPREATVEALDGVTGLGAVTVTYARQKDDGETYDDPTTVKPVNAGTYKVLISFEEGAAFASRKGRNVIEAGTFTIKKAASATASAAVTIPVAGTRTVSLDELGLEPDIGQGAKIKTELRVGDRQAEAVGEVGKTFFTLRRKQAEEDKPLNFDLVLRTDNYVKLTVNATVTAAKVIIGKKSIESFAADGYYIIIYANSEHNVDADKLKSYVTEVKGAYEAHYDDDGTVEFTADWDADDNVSFDPRGQKDNVWYRYTATLAADGDFDETIFVMSPDISHPKAYVKVIPVNAVQTLATDTAALAGTDVKALTNEDDMMHALRLPRKVAVTYAPAESGREIIDQAGEFTGTAGEFTISSWNMDGVPLTLNALKAKVDSASGGDVEVVLTPAYAADTVPAWATLEDPPEFTLTIIGTGETGTSVGMPIKPGTAVVVAMAAAAVAIVALILFLLRLSLRKRARNSE